MDLSRKEKEQERHSSSDRVGAMVWGGVLPMSTLGYRVVTVASGGAVPLDDGAGYSGTPKRTFLNKFSQGYI